MKSWSEIRDLVGTIISSAFGLLIALLMIVGPLLLIFWAVRSGRYALAAVVAIAYLTALVLIAYLAMLAPRFLMRFSRESGDDVVFSAPWNIEPARRSDVRPVDFSVFAPQIIAPGRSFVLNVWVHFREQLLTVMELAQLVRPSEPVGFRAGVPVELGAQIVLRLHLSTLDVLDELDEVTWAGEPSNASFRIHVPADVIETVHSGHLDIFTGGIRIARVVFELALSFVDPSPSHGRHTRLQSRLERLQTAFASYSSADRADVLGRIQGMRKIAPDLDVFLDALSLRSGELWESRLAEEVISKDIFYLFWSRSAAESTWVTREWQHALAKRGLDYIDPVPLEMPDVAPPPDALRVLHFADAFSTYAFLQRRADRDRTTS